MDEKIVYWVCGLGMVVAFVPLIWVLVQKYMSSKQSTQTVDVVVVTVIDQGILEQMWQVAGDMLYEMTGPYNRLKIVPDLATFTHEVYLTGRRRTDTTGQILVHLRVAVNQEGQPCYFFRLNEGKGTSSGTYPFCKLGMMQRVIEGLLVNPGFTTDTRMGIERPVYTGPEAWTQADQDRHDARLKSLV